MQKLLCFAHLRLDRRGYKQFEALWGTNGEQHYEGHVTRAPEVSFY